MTFLALALALGLTEGMMHTRDEGRNQDIPQLPGLPTGLPHPLSSHAGAGVWSYERGFARQLSRVRAACPLSLPHEAHNTDTLEEHISTFPPHCSLRRVPKPLEDRQAPFWKPIGPVAPATYRKCSNHKYCSSIIQVQGAE